MSTRKLLKTYRSGLFYFKRDQTVMVLGTKHIKNKMYTVGDIVEMLLSGNVENAEVIELSDDTTYLNQQLRDYVNNPINAGKFIEDPETSTEESEEEDTEEEDEEQRKLSNEELLNSFGKRKRKTEHTLKSKRKNNNGKIPADEDSSKVKRVKDPSKQKDESSKNEKTAKGLKKNAMVKKQLAEMVTVGRVQEENIKKIDGENGNDTPGEVTENETSEDAHDQPRGTTEPEHDHPQSNTEQSDNNLFPVSSYEEYGLIDNAPTNHMTSINCQPEELLRHNIDFDVIPPATIASLTQKCEELKEHVAVLNANQVYMQTLIHKMMATQEHMFGKIALLDATKVVFSSPPKRFERNIKPKRISFSNSASRSSSTPICDPVDTTVEKSATQAENSPSLLSPEMEKVGELSFAELQKISFQAQSIPNFAKLIATKLFTLQELTQRNCSGTKGKEKLDVDKLNGIRDYVFEMYPSNASEEIDQWKKCKDAINEFGRRMNKKN